MNRERRCVNCFATYDRFDPDASFTHCARCLHPPLSDKQQAAADAKAEREAARRTLRQRKPKAKRAPRTQAPRKRGPRTPEANHESYLRNIDYHVQYRRAHAATINAKIAAWRQQAKGTESTCVGCGATFLRQVDGASTSRCQRCQVQYKREWKKRRIVSALEAVDGIEVDAEIAIEWDGDT